MKAAVYARVSTLDQEPENQLCELRRYVSARNWTASEYCDRGVSGAKDRRPALDDLLKDARRRRFDPGRRRASTDGLDQAHRPYHSAIDQQIALLLDRFGCALLLDCHSMPPPPAGIAPIVIGDGRGRTAASWLSQESLRIIDRCGFAGGLNDPFAGGHVIERHARPAHGVHALQIEIDRRCYLDRDMTAPGPDFDKAAALIEALAVGLGEALLGRQFATAAE